MYDIQHRHGQLSCLLFIHDTTTTEIYTFPTRRSSDLFASAVGRTESSAPSTADDRRTGCISKRRRPVMILSKNQFRRGVARSEEHTSELQSLTNLVCSLLLEKKNT